MFSVSAGAREAFGSGGPVVPDADAMDERPPPVRRTGVATTGCIRGPLHDRLLSHRTGPRVVPSLPCTVGAGPRRAGTLRPGPGDTERRGRIRSSPSRRGTDALHRVTDRMSPGAPRVGCPGAVRDAPAAGGSALPRAVSPYGSPRVAGGRASTAASRRICRRARTRTSGDRTSPTSLRRRCRGRSCRSAVGGAVSYGGPLRLIAAGPVRSRPICGVCRASPVSGPWRRP